MTQHHRRSVFILPLLIWTASLCVDISLSHSGGKQTRNQLSGSDDVFIYQIAPDRRGGRAYKLVYTVKAPINTYWRFKTDFDNAFLEQNKFIREHNFISRNGLTVVTEDRYSHGSEAYFRWQTRVFPEVYRLDFVLLNPEECRQKFHYGHIQLESVPDGTRVTQVAYFDFWGASSWANYPWKGGMKDFLLYTARWEQETVLRLKDRYRDRNVE